MLFFTKKLKNIRFTNCGAKYLLKIIIKQHWAQSFVAEARKHPSCLESSVLVFLRTFLGFLSAMDNSTDQEGMEESTIQQDDSFTVLDLTSYQLHSLESIDFPLNLTELDLTANRLTALDSRIGLLSNLKKLSLRQNLIDDVGVEMISSWDAIPGLEVFNLIPRCYRFCSY